MDSSGLGAPAKASPHAVVIGSGLGGLAVALRLLAKGYRVTVLEKLDGPGGRAFVHELDGFRFDAGPTIVTAPFLFEDLWSLFGRRFADDVRLVEMNPYYRIRFDDGRIFDYSGDEDAVCREIARFNPSDVDGYRRYLAASKQRYEIGFERMGLIPFDRLSDLVRHLPAIIRLRGDRSVYSMVSKYIRDPRVREVLSFHPLLIGGNPFSATSIYTLISYLERNWGVHSAIGGTGAIVEAMVRLINEQGGKIRYGAEVDQILVEDGVATGALLAGGEQVAADVVVSNADSAWTYQKLVPAKYRRRWTDRRIEKARYSTGLFVWYFGVRGTYDEVPHHSILLGPRYKGLLDDIFRHRRLADDFSLYLHRPTATDPSVAPAGHDAFYVLSPVPNLTGKTNWVEEAERYRARIEGYLERTVLPGLGERITCSMVATPEDFQSRLNSVNGAGFSLEPVLTQSAWFRPHNRSEELENLFLVGAGTHPGAGMPGVLSSAVITANMISPEGGSGDRRH